MAAQQAPLLPFPLMRHNDDGGCAMVTLPLRRRARRRVASWRRITPWRRVAPVRRGVASVRLPSRATPPPLALLLLGQGLALQLLDELLRGERCGGERHWTGTARGAQTLGSRRLARELEGRRQVAQSLAVLAIPQIFAVSGGGRTIS